MKPLISIAALLLLVYSCTTGSNKTVLSELTFDTLPVPHDSAVFYFKTKPDRNDNTPNALDSFINQWYSEMLFAMKEPVLWTYKGPKEIYRFTWLRTFHHPVVVRLEKQNNIIRLFSKVTDGAGGYTPGKLIFDTTLNVTDDQYRTLLRKLRDVSFWNLNTMQIDGSTDGSEWIVEAVKDNNYHMVTRHSPFGEGEDNFRRVGEFLISLSKISSEETKELY